VVRRERALLEAGAPSRAARPALQRAALWRAARSGLEGELVDLDGTPRPVPAGVLVRGMVAELRPELEADGCWEIVPELCEAALGRGSAAARQREALRRRQRITDVVDLILEETRARAAESSSAGSLPASTGLQGYEPEGYDEAVLADGRPRSRARRAQPVWFSA
jgi:carboxylate-amine ligase